MKNPFIYLSLTTLLLLNSCNGCSNSGRAKIIMMAHQESQKEQTSPEPNTLVKDSEPEVVKIEHIVTPNEEQTIKNDLIKDKIPPAEGTLIQVEGLVLKEVMELTIDLNTSDSQIEQILTMKKHIQTNWHYVNDPLTTKDTWRSAEATLSLKYNGKYSGDCDDYAILLASIARQIGLKSRMVGGFDGSSGHAFAEFLIKKNDMSGQLKGLDYREDSQGLWISLDWFKGVEHNRFTKDIKIFDSI